jgi:proline iminopeptidase
MRKTILLAIGLLFMPAAAAHSAPPASQASAAPLAQGAHEFDAAGVRLWYRVAGRRGGVPLVFLHGGPGEGSQAFQAVGGPELERTQLLVYFDQRGSGRSARPADLAYYSLDILIEDVERLRLQLGVERIALLGHSFGATLALEYAARYPQHVSALVLAGAAPNLLQSLDLQCARLARDDPAAYARATEGLRAGAFPRCNTMRAYAGDEARAFTRRNLFPDPAVAQRIAALDAAAGADGANPAAQALFAQGLLQYRFVRAAQVQAPVLMIAGGRDYQAAIEPQRALAQALPHARLLEYPASGHFMFAEDPARFARDATDFLRVPRR